MEKINKKRGRPKKEKKDPPKEVIPSKELYIFLYMISGEDHILKKFSNEKHFVEIIKARFARNSFKEFELTISTINKEIVDELTNLSEIEKKTCHWILNRFHTFKFLREKLGYGSFLDEIIYVQTSKDFEVLKDIFSIRPATSFTRKGGHLPKYEEYLHFHILSHLFRLRYPKNNINTLYNIIYSEKIKFLFNEVLKISIPDLQTFGVFIRRQVKHASKEFPTSTQFSNQDIHILYPLFETEMYIELNPLLRFNSNNFWENPVFTNEYKVIQDIASIPKRKDELINHLTNTLY